MNQIQQVLIQHNVAVEIKEFPESTHTAAEAAAALGCEIGQIAKSLIFRTVETHTPILVLASGANRVDLGKLAMYLDEDVEKADADFVKEVTGTSIGGVAPFAHPQQIKTFMDEDLFQYQDVWAAAGSAYSVFKITPQQLQAITSATQLNVKQD